MRRVCVFAVLSLVSLQSLAFAQAGSGITLGTGARAMALAGNHAAVASDLSAVYWNPAALAFLPVREFQISFDGMRLYSGSELGGDSLTVPPGAKLDGFRDRMRVSGFGAMAAMPTIQGGLTLAASFDRPYIFDDFTVFAYEQYGETVRVDGRKYGDLNRWSGAFGVQVAPNVAAGLTVAIVTGTERSPVTQELSGDGLYYYAKYNSQSSYLGYALDLGALCRPMDILSVGLKISAVSDVRFREVWSGTVTAGDTTTKPRGEDRGRAYAAPAGTLGFGLTLPWLIAALDIRVAAPYTFALPSEDAESIPDDMQAGRFKAGAGIGLEAPLPNAPVVLRAGYSIDTFDLYPLIHKYDAFPVDWENLGVGFWPDQNRHTLAVGAGLFTSGVGLELSYAYQSWGLTGPIDYGASFRQGNSSHRLMAAVIYRY